MRKIISLLIEILVKTGKAVFNKKQGDKMLAYLAEINLTKLFNNSNENYNV